MDTENGTAAETTLTAGAGNDTITTAGQAAGAPEGDKNPWKHTIVACGTKITAGTRGNKVIVVQTRTRKSAEDIAKLVEDAKGGFVAEFAGRDYPKGDAYLRMERGVDFGTTGDAEVFELGGNLRQWGFGGLSPEPGAVCTGPSHPAHAAMDLAVQKGAEWVTFDGLDDAEKEQLEPWLDQVRSDSLKIDFT